MYYSDSQREEIYQPTMTLCDASVTHPKFYDTAFIRIEWLFICNCFLGEGSLWFLVSSKQARASLWFHLSRRGATVSKVCVWGGGFQTDHNLLARDRELQYFRENPPGAGDKELVANKM